MHSIRSDIQSDDIRGLVESIFALAIVAILVGCSHADSFDQSTELFDPFSSMRRGGNGINVSWHGYTRGYQADSEIPIEIEFQNTTEEEVLGSLCLFVMDETSNAQMPVEKQSFVASHQAGFTRAISLDFPVDLDADTYHLVLVVDIPDGTTVDVITIYRGDSMEAIEPIDQQDIEVAIELCQQT